MLSRLSAAKQPTSGSAAILLCLSFCIITASGNDKDNSGSKQPVSYGQLANLKAVSAPPNDRNDLDGELKSAVERANRLIDAAKHQNLEEMVACVNAVPGAERASPGCEIKITCQGAALKNSVTNISVRRIDDCYCELVINVGQGTPVSYAEMGLKPERSMVLLFGEKGFPISLMSALDGKMFGRQARWTVNGEETQNEDVVTPRDFDPIGPKPRKKR